MKTDMDCKKFEELLIDFIENELDSSEMQAVKKHLSFCSYCSREVEEYKEIRRMLDEDNLSKPSSEALAKLSKIARDRIERDKTPFWKRWFYSPILVPVLSSALALFLWVSYGQNNLDLFFTDKNMYSDEVMAKKRPSALEPTLPVAGERSLEDIELGQARILSKKPSTAMPKDSEVKSGIEASAPALTPSEELPAKELKETDETADYKAEASTGSVDSSPMNEFASEPRTQKEFAKREALTELQSDEIVEGSHEERQRIKEGELYSNLGAFYQNKLDLALKQQRERNCEASIKTNEELLKTSPPPPNSVVEKAYLSLAECYEKRGDWERAILSYQNLQEAASEQARFAEDKIEGLKQKANLFKAKEFKSGSAEQNQKTE
jgi:predicted anti-sigma-YlaC factor YlaD